jgi:hypothetical protein
MLFFICVFLNVFLFLWITDPAPEVTSRLVLLLMMNDDDKFDDTELPTEYEPTLDRLLVSQATEKYVNRLFRWNLYMT